MPTLLVHPDVARHLSQLDVSIREFVEQKISWSKMQLAMNGRVSRVKGTRTQSWRRTPVRGNQYYLWWAPAVEVGVSTSDAGSAIAVRDLRHHDNLEPPSPAGRADYEVQDPGTIDPRNRQQASVAKSSSSAGISSTIVRGQPGTGKTLSLLYAARDLAVSQRILYVTYTRQLADDALAFAKTVGIGENLVVMTLSSLIASILLDSQEAKTANPFVLGRGFEAMIRGLDNSVVGPWAHKGIALWAEARSSVMGMGLPFAWKRGVVTIPACDVLDLSSYCEVSGLDRGPAEKALHLADLAQKRGFLKDQTCARMALERVMQGDCGKLVLDGAQAVMVDEVQDLTPVELALLLELARHTGKNNSLVRFIAAGDESQTVHPSGFEWGIAKDLIRERLGREPKEVDLRQMMRNPGVIHAIVQKTAGLYKNLPKMFRPSGGFVDDSPPVHDVGQAFQCALPRNKRGTLLDALAAMPGRAMVCLEKVISEVDSSIATKESVNGNSWAAVTFRPSEIKGLERRIVVATGLDEALENIERLTKSETHERRSLESLEARYLIDAVRVALSRATDTLIIIGDESGQTLSSPLAKSLLDSAPSIELDELLILLEKDDLSDEERVSGFLVEAQEFANRNEVARAFERLERAEAVMQNLTNEVLSETVTKLRRELEKNAGLRIIVAPSGGDYALLEEAIANASPGATILVRPGIYSGPFIIEKNLRIVANGPRESVVLEHNLNAVFIKECTVTLEGLTISCCSAPEEANLASAIFQKADPGKGTSFEKTSVRGPVARFKKEKDEGQDSRVDAVRKLIASIFGDENSSMAIIVSMGKGTFHHCDIRGRAGIGIGSTSSQIQVIDCNLREFKTAFSLGLHVSATIEKTSISDVEFGIYATKNARLIVRSCKLTSVEGDALHLESEVEALIEENTIEEAKRFGLLILNSVEALVRKNRFHRCYGGIKVNDGASGIYEENDINKSEHVGFWVAIHGDPTVRNNRIRGGEKYGLFMDVGARGQFEENQITGSEDTAVTMCGENHVVFRNSIVSSNAKNQSCVHIGTKASGVFELNDVSHTKADRASVCIDAGPKFIVRKNKFHRLGRHGVNIRIEGCVFEDNEVCEIENVAILVSNAAKPIVARNKIHHAGFGLVIRQESSGVYEGNEIYVNSSIGIWIQQVSPTIRRNRIHHCLKVGILVDGPSSAVMESNEIWECAVARGLEGVILVDAATPTLSQNIIRGGNVGLCVRNHSGGVVEKNEIVGTSNTAVIVTEGSTTEFRGNRIHRSSRHAVFLVNSDSVFEDNEVFSNRGAGVSVNGGNSIVRNNRIYENVVGGIALQTDGGLCEHNMVMRNHPFGMIAYHPTSPTVLENVVEGSPIGLIICAKTQGTYVGNQFRGNAQADLLLDPEAAPLKCENNVMEKAPIQGSTEQYYLAGPKTKPQEKKKGKRK